MMSWANPPTSNERLMLQGRLLRPYAEKCFGGARVVPGMRVLDIGSGMGDVALLAADMVGPGGWVVGIDRDAAALDHARRRAEEQVVPRGYETKDKLDALVGRYILLYQPDAAACGPSIGVDPPQPVQARLPDRAIPPCRRDQTPAAEASTA